MPYTGYAPVAVARGSFTVTGDAATGFTAVNSADIEFPACTGSGASVTGAQAYTAETGGKLISSATVSLAVAENSLPVIRAGQLSFTSPTEGLLELLFNNVALSGLGDANGLQATASAGNVYIRLSGTPA